MNEYEVTNCPRCGATPTPSEQDSLWMVECKECEISTPLCTSIVFAYSEWEELVKVIK